MPDEPTENPPPETPAAGDAGWPKSMPILKKEVSPVDPSAPPARRSFLRQIAWVGGLGGIGGLAGLAVNRLKNPQPSGAAKAPLGAEFTYDVARFQTSDPALLKFEEASRFAVGLERAGALAVAADGVIFVGGIGGVRKFSATGEPLATFALDQPVTALALRPSGELLVGQKGRLLVLDASGAEVAVWSGFAERFLPTSIALGKEHVFVADAGNRVVVKLDPTGKQLAVIGARDLDRNLRGFVVPSPYFTVRMGPDGLLRISNPGEHTIEAFTLDGDLETAWGKGSFAVEGFCGCCNPVNFEMFPDGSFVTCEKGLPRVKLYDSHGEFTGLVAGPEAFPEYLQAANAGTPETLNVGIYAAVDATGRVIILDAVGGTVRLMKPKP